ncbi:aspartoacylase [Fulvivirga sp. RKSG066]|uniref:succinylglutamate desuccinylase/aspartoacylase family protein n=1 Tax=Fulvivirga aurantia TaxID=2529383 RepID=UPI0012BC5144|nr:succinylglutamate desuccinylase/aspartoacylase family protein [Fulvivirga aurantia]MTI22201.1 aspartoacylase [Fulvivirga aurantia]
MKSTVVAPTPIKKTKKYTDRILGIYDKNTPGPTIICICGMHGNEPSGVIAFEKVIEQLRHQQLPIKGRLMGVLGNMSALEKGERYNQYDLNRLWTAENMMSLQQDRDHRTFKDALEQKELHETLTSLLGQNQHPYYFIDLHTTSAKSTPYISINDTLRNREIALRYPLPIVLGLEEHLEGTILNYINKIGHISLGFEAGQHDDPLSIKNHEAIIWLTLFNTHCISGADIPALKKHFEQLSGSINKGKNVYEVRYRHAIASGEHFTMNPGFVNFQSVKKDQALAINGQGSVKSPEKGLIFMPLYQSKGDDGFFIIRKIRWVWLKFSAVLRRTKFHRVLHFLPGIYRYNALNYTLVINKKIAKWFVVEFFHLMGFRLKRKQGNFIIFIKREFDVDAPHH